MTGGQGAGGCVPFGFGQAGAANGLGTCESVGSVSDGEASFPEPWQGTAAARQHEDLVQEVSDTDEGSCELQAFRSCPGSEITQKPGSSQTEQVAAEEISRPAGVSCSSSSWPGTGCLAGGSDSYGRHAGRSGKRWQEEQGLRTMEAVESNAERQREEQVAQEGQGQGQTIVPDPALPPPGFSALGQDEWHAAAARVLTASGSVAALGIRFLGLMLHSPTQSGTNSRLQLFSWFTDSPRISPLLKGDLLPLPMVLTENELVVVAEAFADPGSRFSVDASSEEFGAKCWLQGIIFTLNSMWAAPHSVTYSDKDEKPWPGLDPASHRQANQTEAMRLLERYVSDFLCDSAGQPLQMVSKDWAKVLRRKRLDYSGHIVSKAVPVTWRQLEPGLPPEDCAARVDSLALAEGRMHELLSDPSLVLLPREEWPQKFSNTKVQVVSDDEWGLICRGFFNRRMVRKLTQQELIRDSQGTPLGSGLLGVGTDKVTSDGEDVLRTVFNLPPSNDLQAVIEGDVGTLPYQGLWQGLIFDDPTLLHWFSEDMVASFFLFALPPQWAPVFAFEREAPGWSVDSDEDTVPIGLTIVPPGWLSANGVIQYLHRRLVHLSSALPPTLELRKDRPRPTGKDFQSTSFFSVYVDNLDAARAERSDGAEPVEEWFLAAKSTGQIFGVLYHDGQKSQSYSVEGRTLGSEIRSEGKSSRPVPEKLLTVIGESLWLMQLPVPFVKDVEMIGGSWVHLIQYRRPVMGTVEHLWSILRADCLPDQRWLLLADDLVRLVSLSPLLASYWSHDVDDVVTCSDASESGAGACASVKLSPLGLERLAEAEALRSVPPADSLLLVDLFAGISASRRALQLLGVSPGSHVSSEVNEDAMNIVKMHFQNVRELGDVRDITAQSLTNAISDNPHVRHVLVVAGFPCQDLSGANPDAVGLQGKRSALFHEALRVLRKVIPAALPQAEIQCVFENVASMKAAFRDQISDHCGTTPYRCCPSDVWPVGRPRFWWLSYSLDGHDFVNVTHRDGFAVAELLGAKRDVREFLQKGRSVATSFTVFPTFVTAKTRTSPRFMPNGIASCSADELVLWEQSGFRLPPYHYMLKNLVFDSTKQAWATPTPELKEKLMLFRPDYTFMKKSNKQTLGLADQCDLRESLLGNSMHAGVLATLLMPVLKDWKFIHDFVEPAHLATASRQPRLAGSASPELRLVRAYFSYQDHRGGLILCESGQSRMRSRPLAEKFDAKQWTWKPVISCKWSLPGEHINALESRALLLTLRWRARSVARFSKRFLHLTDSKVALGSFAKHRSNSRSYNYIVTRSAALQLAASMQPVLAFVRSARNPADLPSRRLLALRPKGRQAPRSRPGAVQK